MIYTWIRVKKYIRQPGSSIRLSSGGLSGPRSSALLAVLVVALVSAGVLAGGYLGSSYLPRTTTRSQTFTSTSTTTTSQSFTSTSTAYLTATTTAYQTETTSLTRVTTVTASSVAASSYISLGYQGGPVTQSCLASAAFATAVSCSLVSPVTRGHLLVAELSDVSGNVTDALGSTFRLVAIVTQPSSTYSIQLFVASAKSSGVDTFTASGYGNYPNMVVHELNLSSFLTSSTLSGGTASPSVAPYSAPLGSFVLAVVLAANKGEWVAPGSGQTFMGQYPGVIADEYSISSSAQAISPFMLSAPVNWAEISAAFA